MTTAVVTGATSGIGLAYAHHLARQGHDLVIAARTADRLRVVGEQLTREHGVAVENVVADLSTAGGVSRLVDVGTGASVLVANSGSTLAARTGTAPWSDLEHLSYLLGPGVAQLCEGLVPSMVERGSGRISIVASIGAVVPMPKSAVYAAAKSYALAYGRSLHAELAGRGVRVCTICPGYVRTSLHENSGLGHLPDQVPRWLWIDPEDVVREAEQGLDRNRAMVVPGTVYRVARPFLQSSAASLIWRRITRRRR